MIIFHYPGREHIRSIVDIQLRNLLSILSRKSITATFDSNLREYLADKGV